ncbi:MAG: hypothetical protein CMM94_03695 [Rickettsiales bacterium]|nr:hypothetical protein [Rickettsiales bacterium]
MLELSLAEIVIIGVLALLVVGPQDLPKVLRAVMGLGRQVQDMWREVRDSVGDLAEESGVKDLQKDLNQDVKYIVDQNGEYQQVFDISDLQDADITPRIVEGEPDAQNAGKDNSAARDDEAKG